MQLLRRRLEALVMTFVLQVLIVSTLIVVGVDVLLDLLDRR